jgi:hypothetical protein
MTKATFLSLLQETSITFIPDVAKYGWSVRDESVPTPGFEAISPYGEIKCFDTYDDARTWRNAEIVAMLTSERELGAW